MNNAYLVAVKDPLACTYNDSSVLENRSAKGGGRGGGGEGAALAPPAAALRCMQARMPTHMHTHSCTYSPPPHTHTNCRHVACLYGLCAAHPELDIFRQLEPSDWREVSAITQGAPASQHARVWVGWRAPGIFPTRPLPHPPHPTATHPDPTATHPQPTATPPRPPTPPHPAHAGAQDGNLHGAGHRHGPPLSHGRQGTQLSCLFTLGACAQGWRCARCGGARATCRRLASSPAHSRAPLAPHSPPVTNTHTHAAGGVSRAPCSRHCRHAPWAQAGSQASGVEEGQGGRAGGRGGGAPPGPRARVWAGAALQRGRGWDHLIASAPPTHKHTPPPHPTPAPARAPHMQGRRRADAPPPLCLARRAPAAAGLHAALRRHLKPSQAPSHCRKVRAGGRGGWVWCVRVGWSVGGWASQSPPK